MTYFPLMLDLRNRPVLLIGGGPETGAKLQALLEAQARVTVLAEEDRLGLERLQQEGRIRWLRRSYREGDLEGYFLVVSHPKDKGIHPQVREEAERRGVFLVAVDDPKHASAILPAVLRRGELLVALSTSGAAPALAVRLKERLARLLPETLGGLVAYLRTLRPRIARIPGFEARKALWYRIVDLALEELDLDPKEGLPRAIQRAEEILSEVPFGGGSVDKVKAAKNLVQEALAQSQNPCLTCSFQAEDVVVLHLLLQERPDIPVLFLDTGYHFPEVYAYRDQMAKRLGFRLVNLLPELSREEQESRYGRLYETDPHRCCQIRKVEPLFRALRAYDTWFTGLRREQSPTRASLQPVEEALLPSGHRLRKVSPLYDWTLKEVFAYLAVEDLPYLPLYDQGYLSIGCAPCTAKPLDPNDPRSGRWAGKGKLECGIHLHGKEG